MAWKYPISRNFNTTFEVYRTSSSVDINNFQNETMKINNTYLGNFQPLSGAERYFSDRKQLYANYKLFTNILDVTEKDEIHIAGTVYDIDLVQNFLDHHLEIYLIERK